MFLNVLKNLLRALPVLLVLALLTDLILDDGGWLSINGVSPLAERWQQWALLSVLYLCGFMWLWRARRTRIRRARSLAQEACKALDELAEPSARERRLREQLDRWRLENRTSRVGPVFLLLGWPGAGKHTLMGRSRCLRVDRAAAQVIPDDVETARVGSYAVMSVNGTLLTQADSDESRLWQYLLKQLKRRRANRAKVAGVVLVINAVQLLRTAATSRDTQALTLRARLEELAAALGNALPVQVIVTHCDRLPGFEPSVLALPAEERDLLVAFPMAGNQQNLSRLADHLASRFMGQQDPLYARLQLEPLTLARVRLYGFPRLWGQMAQVLQKYLQAAFLEQPRVSQVRLQSLSFSARLPAEQAARPVYTQRLVRSLQRCRAHGRWVTPWQSSTAWLRPRLAYGLGLLLLGLGLVFGNSYLQHIRQVEWVAEQRLLLIAQADKPRAGPLGTPLLEWLERLRALAHPPGDGWPHPTFWLSEHRQLLARTRELYHHGLITELLPVIADTLNTSLLNARDSDTQGRLGLYLMLGGQGPFDAPRVEQWLLAQVREGFGQPLAIAQRERLWVHLQALMPLLAGGVTLTVDLQQVERVRQQIVSEPLQQRVYRQLSRLLEKPASEGFSVASASGSEGLLMFARRSGAPLNQGVPARFTRQGHERMQAALPWLVANALKDEEWVLGPGRQLDALAVHDEVLALYEQDYIRHWERFFSDLKLAGLDEPDLLATRLERLSRENSALWRVLQAAGRETWLETPSVAPAFLDKVRQRASALTGLKAGNEALDQGGERSPAEHPVNRHFAPLHQLTNGAAGVSGPLTALREALALVAVSLSARAQAPEVRLPAPQGNGVAPLTRVMDDLPLLLVPLFADIVHVGQHQLHQQSVTAVGASLNRDIGPDCTRLLTQRYPFDRTASEQVPIADFNRWFGPSGRLPDFFARHPDIHVLEPAVTAQFQRAEQIRRGFFPGTSDTARVDFELSPVTLDENIAQFRLTLDDRQLNYAHGPIRPQLFTWPSPALGGQLKAVVTLIDGRILLRTAEGPWAWFRFMDQGRLGPAPSADARWLTLDFEDHEVVLQVRSASLDHPFGRNALGDFRCPTTTLL